MRPSTEPDVSVVLATYGRPDQLPRALRSLAEQTLDPPRFEVVVVPNGPPGEVLGVLQEARGRFPELRLREAISPRPGVAHARAVGVAAARGTWMTMLDDDDWLSAAYLERLLDAAAPGTVPLAQIADVAEDSAEPDLDNLYAVAFAARRGERVPAEQLPEAVSLNVCKLLPTATARACGFDTRLRSASDTLFWLGVLSRAGWTFNVLDADDAVYYRMRGHGSLSRQDTTLDFSVVRRLEGLRSLAAVPRTRRSLDPVLERTARSLSSHVRRFLLENPDRRDEVVALTEGFEGGPPSVHWRTVNVRTASELVLLPHADLTSPELLALLRRVRQRGRPVDMASTASTRQLRDAPEASLAHPYLARLLTAPPGADLADWLLERVAFAADQLTPYDVVRTLPHDGTGAAARHVREHPGLHWIAEVDRTTAPAALPALLEADEVVTPSEDDLAALVAKCTDTSAADRLRARARIEPLAPVAGHLWRGAAGLCTGAAALVHLGDARPCDVPALASAIADLPPRLRASAQLVVCSGRAREVGAAGVAAGLGDVLRTRPLPGLRDGLDLVASAAVLLVDRPAPAHLAPEVAAHPAVVDLRSAHAAQELVAALGASTTATTPKERYA